MDSKNNNEQVSRVLIENGADLNISDKGEWNPLHAAAFNNNEQVTRLLIEKGADVNIPNIGGETPLLLAAEKNNEQIVGVLIEHGANVNISDKDGQTPLFKAAKNNNEQVARLLIEEGEHVNISDEEGWMPLHVAALNNNEQVARLLIEKGADLNIPTTFGETPLFLAAEYNNEQVARLLIKKGANVNILNELGQTPLFVAAENNHEQIARVLIENGADLNIPNTCWETPLFLAAENNEQIARVLIENGASVNIFNELGQTPLFKAAKNNNEQIARLLIDKGADVNISDEDESTPLFVAAKNINEQIPRLLIENGASVNIFDEVGQTPLFIAAENTNEQIARVLIENGADVNISDVDGQTPLFIAAENNNEQIARFLIENGADVNISDIDGQTPLFKAAENTNEQIGRLFIENGADVNISDKCLATTPLINAAKYNNEQVARLLIENGADVNISDEDEWTPLHSAALNNNEQVTRLLIEKGADLNIPNIGGETPLFVAAKNKKVSRLLIENGAVVNISDEVGQTPLFEAAENNNEQVARMLIENGADVNRCDTLGRTSLFRAAKNNNGQVVRLLIENGADVNTFDTLGQTSLFTAAQYNNEQVARLLIENGADVNIFVEHGETPLFAAMKNNNEQVARLLIENGADVNISDKYGRTSLFWASQYNNEQLTRLLIENGANVNDLANVNNTELPERISIFSAVECNNEQVAQLLSENSDDVNKPDTIGRTPLFIAAENNKEQVVRLLIENGADVNKSDTLGRTSLFRAAEKNNEQVARLLIKNGADVNKYDKHDQTPLFVGAANNNEQVVRLLIENGADVNISNEDGRTPLFKAAANNNERVAQFLIEKGADVNISDEDGETPLFKAAENNNEEVARMLIENGADVNISNEDGITPLLLASVNRDGEQCAHLLIENDADVNVCNRMGETPLISALKNESNQVADLLFRSNADINLADNSGRTALFYLAGLYGLFTLEDPDSDIRKELARKIAFACRDINKMDDNEGRTALTYAIEQTREMAPFVRILLEADADVNMKDDNGQPPLFYARTPLSIRLLLDHGADLDARNNKQETSLICAIKNLDSVMRQSNFVEFYHQLFSCCKPDVKARDMYGRTAMFHAVTACNTMGEFKVIADILLYNGAVLTDFDNNDVSVLSHFIEKNCCNQFKDAENDVSKRLTFFVENGILKLTVFSSTLNYLYAILPNYLHSSNATNRREIFANAITIASNYASDDDKKGLTRFIALLDKDKLPEALDVLIKLGANPKSVDPHGNTALHYASVLPFHGVSPKNVMEIIQTLEKHGVKFNVKNQEKETPLHLCLHEQAWNLASQHGTWKGLETVVEICKFLMKDGSLISETTRGGESVYHLIMKFIEKGLLTIDKKIREVICVNAAKLLELFSNSTGNQAVVLNKTDDKLKSPLHLWASLSLGPGQNYADHISKELNSKVFLDVILKHLLKPGVIVNPRNIYGQTPLHCCKTWTAVELLIRAGANTIDFDTEGRPPLLNVVSGAQADARPGHFLPDVQENQEKFFETCLSLDLDIWSSDNKGESILSIFLKSEDYLLANALIDVAVSSCNSTTILKELLETVCNDESTSATWKSLLTRKLLNSPKSPSKTNLDGALFNCCNNIRKLHDQGKRFQFEDGQSSEPPKKKARIKSKEQVLNGAAQRQVHVDIARQLLLHQADGSTCKELCTGFPELHLFLTTKVDLDNAPMIIPWTSYSKMHEDKLKRVSRKQNVQTIGTFWFHKERIGMGSFGNVFAGISTKDGREVAIKKIERLRIVRPEDKREIKNLTALADCQQVVSYIFFDDSEDDFVYTVLELMEGHLDDYFASSSFDQSRSGILCKDVVEGLKYLHEHKPKAILHRDLKPGNILYKLHPKLCLKIADFGLSSPITTAGTTVLGTNVGTRCWIAPEVVSSNTYQHFESSDVFSCGLLLHYILSKQKHPFSPTDCTTKSKEVEDIETQSNLLSHNMEGWHEALSPLSTHLIKGMLQKDVSQRPSADDSLSHPFFWSRKRKNEFLSVVGNQYEFECPSTIKAACYHVTTGVEADLESNFANIVRYAKWDDPNYKDMAKVVAEMNKPIAKVNKKGATYFQHPRAYDTGSIIELVRFIRNSTNHVSDRSRPSEIRKLILEDFVFLKEFPHLLIEVYKAVITHGWDNRDEIKYAMTHEEQHH